MICFFCNKECKKYTNGHNYVKYIHYKCKYEFEHHTSSNFITFKTDKYAFLFYLDDDYNTIIINEIYKINKKIGGSIIGDYINVNLKGVELNSLFKDDSFSLEYINERLEGFLEYA